MPAKLTRRQVPGLQILIDDRAFSRKATSGLSMAKKPTMQRMDSASSDELLWVNVKKPADIKNAGIMKQIRSHTQREVRRKERISKPKPISTSKRCTKETERPQVLSARVVPDVRQKEEKEKKEAAVQPADIVDERTMIQSRLQGLAVETLRDLSPPLAVAISPRDPVRLNQKIYRYLSVWQGERAHQLCGGDIHGRWETWMPSIPGNETMMYAQAFCAATHFEFWGRQSTTTDTCWLKDQAVMQVNKHIASPDFSQNDGNIASVLCLAFASHVEDAGRDNCMTHMHGLDKIISMRGGWERLLSNELLSDLLAMVDFLSAIIFKTNLIYTPKDTDQPDINVHDPLYSPLISPSFFFNQPLQGDDLCSEAFHTLNNMQQLTASFEQLFNNQSPSFFGSTRMGEHFKSLQPRSSIGSPARSSPSSTVPSPTKSTISIAAVSSRSSTDSSVSSHVSQKVEYIRDNLNEAIRLAGLIYYRALVLNIRFDDEVNVEDGRRLKDCIEATALTGWSDFPGVFLWVLLVATATLRSQPEGFIVSGHLSTSTLSVGVRHWVPVRRVLEKFRLIEAMVDQNAYNTFSSGSSSATSATSGSSGFSKPWRESSSDTDNFDEHYFQGKSQIRLPV